MFSQLDMPRFTTAAVAHAAGIPLDTLGTWLKRGQIAAAPSGIAEGRHPGTGRSRLWSARRALHVVLTARLAPTLDVREASAAALHFTDFGSVADDFPGFGPDIPARQPGELIPGASRTVFRLTLPRGGAAAVPSVEPLDEVKDSLFAGAAAVLLIDLDDLRARALASLEASVR